jgi:4-hydroxy-3-methylbut-2-enyl diphosphate reductase IspH
MSCGGVFCYERLLKKKKKKLIYLLLIITHNKSFVTAFKNTNPLFISEMENRDGQIRNFYVALIFAFCITVGLPGVVLR